MKAFYRRTTRLWRLVLVVVLVALGTIGMSANAAYAAHTQMVPFSGSYSGAVSFAVNRTPLFNGIGISTHMGRGTSDGYVVVTSVTPGGDIVNDNYETLTAANGDTLTILSHDVASPILTMPGWYHGMGQWSVTGGTGRFKDATGKGTLDGISHPIPGGTFNFQITGTISAPGGN